MGVPLTVSFTGYILLFCGFCDWQHEPVAALRDRGDAFLSVVHFQDFAQDRDCAKCVLPNPVQKLLFSTTLPAF
jgi:hypothetical protein